MAITLTDIDHVVLYARDQAALVDFYCDVLGCAVVRRNEAVGLVHLSAGRAMLDILPMPADGGGRNMDHVAFRVAHFDGAAITRHLAGFGIAATPVKDRFGALGTGPSLTFQDPEGNTIELKGPTA